MVTGCGCHDPLVFGHQLRCSVLLGPADAGMTLATDGSGMWGYMARYNRGIARDNAGQAARKSAAVYSAPPIKPLWWARIKGTITR